MGAFNVFRQPRIVKRHNPGSYVDGVWVEGSVVTIPNVLASCQPATAEDMQSLEENRRTNATFRLYSDFAFRTAKEDDYNPDIVILFD